MKRIEEVKLQIAAKQIDISQPDVIFVIFVVWYQSGLNSTDGLIVMAIFPVIPAAIRGGVEVARAPPAYFLITGASKLDICDGEIVS